MTQYFVIPGRLPGLNEVIGSNRKNPFAGAKVKKASDALVRQAIRFYRMKPMKTPVAISISWREKNRRRDPDNILSGKKFIFDALVREGILPDDGWKEIGGISESWAVDKENPRIVVVLEEIR